MIAEVAGHFGEWLQGRYGPNGEIVAVTVRCPALGVRVERASFGPFGLEGDAAVLPAERASLLLARLGLATGRFRISASMPPGGGAGASTAALVALARAAGHAGTGLAKACVSVEGATDPLMLPEPDAVLWAPRRARIIEHLAPPPALEIIGGFYGAPQVTDPSDTAFPQVSDLVDRWRKARTIETFAAIATASAQRTTALRGPKDDPTAGLASQLGALGWIRAHTGSARGLIFRAGAAPDGGCRALGIAGLTGIVRFKTGIET